MAKLVVDEVEDPDNTEADVRVTYIDVELCKSISPMMVGTDTRQQAWWLLLLVGRSDKMVAFTVGDYCLISCVGAEWSVAVAVVWE